MNAPIVQIGTFAFKVKVFEDHIEWKLGFSNVSIPISQISSMNTNNMLSGKMAIETTGGKKYEIPLSPKHREELKSAILAQQNKVPSTAASISGSDEIAKYAALRDNGTITEDEFQAKKHQLLGL